MGRPAGQLLVQPAEMNWVKAEAEEEASTHLKELLVGPGGVKRVSTEALYVKQAATPPRKEEQLRGGR